MNKMLLSAAWYNWLAAIIFVGASDWTLTLLRLESSPSTLLFLHFFCTLAFFFGISYYQAASDLAGHASSIKLAAIAKLSLVAVTTIDVTLGLVSWPILVPIFGDLVYGILFFRALSQLPESAQPS